MPVIQKPNMTAQAATGILRRAFKDGGVPGVLVAADEVIRGLTVSQIVQVGKGEALLEGAPDEVEYVD